MTIATAKDLSDWLKENHSTKNELWVKIFKKNSEVQNITWNDVVIEILCLSNIGTGLSNSSCFILLSH